MSYREYPPPPSLAPFVECFWTRTPVSASRRSGSSGATSVLPDADSQNILPDGCLDVLVDLSRATPDAFVVGPMSRPHLVEGASVLDLVAVRFRPGGAHAFFATPLHEWRDRHVDAAEAWGASARWIDALGMARNAGSRAAAVAVLAAELERRRPSIASHARRSVALAAAVRAAAPDQSIAGLAASLGFTRQHLTRTFEATVGVGPKLLQRIARMQRALALLDGRRELGLAAVALEAGYADQSHLTNELRELCGATPARRRAEAR